MAVMRQFSEEQIRKVLTALGSDEPKHVGNALAFQTVCHNPAHHGSHKLYFYPDSCQFHCYTHCGDSFD